MTDQIPQPADALVAELLPCPFCGGQMQFRQALWPSEGDTDAVIHAAPTNCPLSDFSNDTFDGSVIPAWNTRARLPSSNAAVELTPLDAEIEAALHHLQADGAIDRGGLAEVLRKCRQARAPSSDAAVDVDWMTDWKARYEHEFDIVDRCWKALGFNPGDTWESTGGKAIWEIITDRIEAARAAGFAEAKKKAVKIAYVKLPKKDAIVLETALRAIEEGK